MTYGTRMYRLDNSISVGDLVKKLDEDHGMTEGMTYMDNKFCSLYTSDAADDLLCVDLGGRRSIKKKK